jgi:hypothetical protein
MRRPKPRDNVVKPRRREAGKSSLTAVLAVWTYLIEARAVCFFYSLTISTSVPQTLAHERCQYPSSGKSGMTRAAPTSPTAATTCCVSRVPSYSVFT